MIIMVTGSSGFIASKLVNRLLSEGHHVKLFDKTIGNDILDLEMTKRAIKGMDVVFHLAAIADLNWAREHPLETYDINVTGTRNVAWACHEYDARLYYASTVCCYGNQKVHPSTEETLPNPSEIYACTKLAGENIIKGIHHTYGLDYNLMRFATIYGPGAREALATSIFLKQALRGEPITVHGDGKQTRTLTYVDDLVDAQISLLNSEKVNEIWNMSAGEGISALRMAEDIKRLTKSDSPIVHVEQRVGQTFKEVISSEKMERETSWKAKTSWEDGIAKMLDWYVGR